MGGKFFAVERALLVSHAGNLTRGLATEISHHSHADAVAAQQIMHATLLSHVRQRVQRKRHVARPCMRNLRPKQLRKTVGHETVEDWRTLLRCYGGEPCATTEDHALTVR